MIQKPKGTKDILPQDSYKWQYIEQKTKELLFFRLLVQTAPKIKFLPYAISPYYSI